LIDGQILMNSKSKPKLHKPTKGIVFDQLSIQKAKRGLLRDALRPNEERDLAFRHMILSIPPGKVSTYGAVAAAAPVVNVHT